MCVCVCVYERERERERKSRMMIILQTTILLFDIVNQDSKQQHVQTEDENMSLVCVVDVYAWCLECDECEWL